MTLIRPHQRAVTGLFPHNANRRYIIPNRGPAGLVPDGSPVVTTVTMLITFTGDVQTAKPGNLDGFSVTVNAVGGVVTDLTFPATGDQILVTFTPIGLSTQVVVVTYDGTGLLQESLSLLPVLAFVESGAVP